MTRIAKVGIGGKNPVRIMGILNTSPESFYKKSIQTTKTQIKNSVKEMENDGADFIDVGGMSTAPYLSTMVSEKTESKRILEAVKIIQDVSNIPISVDTCRAKPARDALENGVEIINDISGLKYDERSFLSIEYQAKEAPDLEAQIKSGKYSFFFRGKDGKFRVINFGKVLSINPHVVSQIRSEGYSP